jgi:hypothetical protein
MLVGKAVEIQTGLPPHHMLDEIKISRPAKSPGRCTDKVVRLRRNMVTRCELKAETCQY